MAQPISGAGAKARPGLVAGVALALALAALASGWYAFEGWRAHRRMAQEWPRAEAVVLRVEYRTIGSRSRQVQAYPVLAFSTADGQAVEARSVAAAPSAEHPSGHRVMVVFDPADPTRVQPVSTLPPSAGAAVRGGFVAAFVLVAIAAMLLAIPAILRRRAQS